MLEVIVQVLDIHHLKIVLPFVGQEEVTVESWGKEEALGQMQYLRGPGHKGT